MIGWGGGRRVYEFRPFCIALYCDFHWCGWCGLVKRIGDLQSVGDVVHLLGVFSWCMHSIRMARLSYSRFDS